MSQRMKEVEIDGRTYMITQFSGDKGAEMFWTLGQVLGGPLGNLMGALMGSGKGKSEDLLDREIDGDLLGKAFSSAFKAMPAKEAIAFIKELLSGTRVDGQPINFALHFAGDMALLFRVLAQVLEVNYGNFLGGIVGRERSGLAAMVKDHLGRRTSKEASGTIGGPSLQA